MTRKRKLLICFFVAKAVLTAIFVMWIKMEPEQVKSINRNTMQSKQEKTIIAFGDSLTKGYGLPAEKTYPYMLEEKLRQNNLTYAVKNFGINGEISEHGLKRIDAVIAENPEIVILELGINDELRKMDAAETKKNLSAIIEQLQKNNIKVVLAGFISPWSLVFPNNEFNRMYPELAETYNLALIPYFLDGVSLDADLNLEDGIHPNEKGNKKIVEENVWPVLKKVL